MKIVRLAAFILLAAAMLLPSAGCLNRGPIEQAVVCSKVTSTGAPEVASDNFTPDVRNIYCSVKLTYTSAKIDLRAEWYLVKSTEAELSNYVIGEQTLAALTPYVVFAFTRSDKLLPRGDYEVRLYYDGQLAQSVPFKVAGEGSSSAAELSEITTCTSINLLTEEPIFPTAVFPSDITKIFCSVKVAKADFGTSIKARWTYVSGDLATLAGKTIAEPTTKVSGREYVSFSIATPPDRLFPAGEYKVTFFIENREAGSIPFSVIGPTAIKWPYISEASTFIFKDQDKTAATLTAMFKSDVKEIDYRFKVYNAPPQTAVTVQWIISKSTDLTLLDETVKEDKTTVDGISEVRGALIRSKDKFVTGDYIIKILINDEEVASLPFKVY